MDCGTRVTCDLKVWTCFPQGLADCFDEWKVRQDRTVTILTQQNPRHHQSDQPAESTGQAEEGVGHGDPAPSCKPQNTSPGSGLLLCAADASGKCDKRVGVAMNDSLRDNHWEIAIKRGGEGPFFHLDLLANWEITYLTNN